MAALTVSRMVLPTSFAEMTTERNARQQQGEQHLVWCRLAAGADKPASRRRRRETEVGIAVHALNHMPELRRRSSVRIA